MFMLVRHCQVNGWGIGMNSFYPSYRRHRFPAEIISHCVWLETSHRSSFCGAQWMNPSTPAYYRHRFPAEIISHCVWLYFCFSLSFCDVEEMAAERGVTV